MCFSVSGLCSLRFLVAPTTPFLSFDDNVNVNDSLFGAEWKFNFFFPSNDSSSFFNLNRVAVCDEDRNIKYLRELSSHFSLLNSLTSSGYTKKCLKKIFSIVLVMWFIVWRNLWIINHSIITHLPSHSSCTLRWETFCVVFVVPFFSPTHFNSPMSIFFSSLSCLHEKLKSNGIPSPHSAVIFYILHIFHIQPQSSVRPRAHILLECLKKLSHHPMENKRRQFDEEGMWYADWRFR